MKNSNVMCGSAREFRGHVDTLPTLEGVAAQCAGPFGSQRRKSVIRWLSTLPLALFLCAGHAQDNGVFRFSPVKQYGFEHPASYRNPIFVASTGSEYGTCRKFYQGAPVNLR